MILLCIGLLGLIGAFTYARHRHRAAMASRQWDHLLMPTLSSTRPAGPLAQQITSVLPTGVELHTHVPVAAIIAALRASPAGLDSVYGSQHGEIDYLVVRVSDGLPLGAIQTHEINSPVESQGVALASAASAAHLGLPVRWVSAQTPPSAEAFRTLVQGLVMDRLLQTRATSDTDATAEAGAQRFRFTRVTAQ